MKIATNRGNTGPATYDTRLNACGDRGSSVCAEAGLPGLVHDSQLEPMCIIAAEKGGNEILSLSKRFRRDRPAD